MAQQLTNFVKTTLNTTITDVATSIIVDAASSPWSTPPDPAGNTQTITLTDDQNNPTKFEIVTYTGRTGAGPYTLTGCTRGAESTTAQAWTAGAVIVGEATAGSVQEALDTVSQALAEAGTSTAEYNWTPQRVAQAIAALGGGGGGAWNLIQTQTISGTPSVVDFTTGIDGTYDMYVFVLSNIVVTYDSDTLFLRVSSGASFKTDATYKYHISMPHSASTAYSALNSSGASLMPLAYNIGNATGEGASGYVTLHGPANTSLYKMITGVVPCIDFDGLVRKNEVHGAWTGGVTAIDGIRFLLGVSTFASGTISLYGVTK